jgi:hypothetical protein
MSNVSGFTSHHTTGGSNQPGMGSSLIRMKGRRGVLRRPALHAEVALADLRVIGPREVEDDQVEVRETQTLPKRVGLRSVGGGENLIALPAKLLGASSLRLGLVADQHNNGLYPWRRHGSCPQQ